MTIEEKRREIFEPIAKGFQMEMERWGDGYYFVDTQNAWEIFNAALDSVVIELPQKVEADPEVGEEYDEYAMGANCMLRHCRAAIERTGLGIKIK